tara:strand:+ start:811 stop:1080 length:270 start_codon:yes stop_codon:yes gene_type:complete
MDMAKTTPPIRNSRGMFPLNRTPSTMVAIGGDMGGALGLGSSTMEHVRERNNDLVVEQYAPSFTHHSVLGRRAPFSVPPYAPTQRDPRP